MAREADQARLISLKVAVESNPGKRAGFFAQLLGWRREEVSRALTTLNDKGVFFWEDEKGGLWPFDRRK